MAAFMCLIALFIIALTAVLLHGMVKRSRNQEPEFPTDIFVVWLWRNQK